AASPSGGCGTGCSATAAGSAGRSATLAGSAGRSTILASPTGRSATLGVAAADSGTAAGAPPRTSAAGMPAGDAAGGVSVALRVPLLATCGLAATWSLAERLLGSQSIARATAPIVAPRPALTASDGKPSRQPRLSRCQPI